MPKVVFLMLCMPHYIFLKTLVDLYLEHKLFNESWRMLWRDGKRYIWPVRALAKKFHNIWYMKSDPKEKKTYGHKYYVAASIGFEEKSYPFIRKMKWHTRALNLGVWGGFLPKFFVLIFGLSLDKICWLFHHPCIRLNRKICRGIRPGGLRGWTVQCI